MISFAKIMRQVLTETMTFKQLWKNAASRPYKTDPTQTRADRGKHHVRSRSIRVMATENGEAWTFRYKSDHATSTTNEPYHGFVNFVKEGPSWKKESPSADDLPCMVDCDCPDYRFRFAYNNAQAGSGTIGGEGGVPGWKHHNTNNGAAPRPVEDGGVGDYGPGLCKHLCALTEYLKTKVDPDAPDPDEKPEPTTKTPVKQPRPSQGPATSDAPEPGDSYSDSRGDSSGYSDSRGGLEESMGSAAQRLSQFVRENPTFEVEYE